MVAYYTHQRDGAEALHFTNRFDDDEIWVRASLGHVEMDTGETGLPSAARRDNITYFERRDQADGALFSSRLVTSWVWVGGIFSAA